MSEEQDNLYNEEGEIVISRYSPELFSEAVKTFPVSPKDFSFRMLSDGIATPPTKEGEDKYLSECLKRNIIPFSIVNFKYDSRDGSFSFFNPEFSTQSREVVVKGGRFNRIDIIADKYSSCPKQFKYFKENLLPFLLDNDYELSRGEIIFNQGGIFLNEQKKKSLELELRESINDKDKEIILGWFRGLKDTYQFQQGNLFQ